MTEAPTENPVTPDSETDTTEAVEVEAKSLDTDSGGRVYVDNGNTYYERNDGSVTVYEGDCYDVVVPLVSLFPEKF